MRRCRCCRQEWPLEFYPVCRPDGLRRRRCSACRAHCGPGSTNAQRRRYRATLRDAVLAVRAARRAA